MGLMREFETVSENKKSETRFFCPFLLQKCIFGDPGHKPDLKIRISGNETPDGSRTDPWTRFSGFQN